jgi:hypothetical protein
MKINKLVTVLGLFLVLNSGLQAQNGSFMGRRILFNLTTNFSPAWGNPNFFNNSDHWEKYYAFNFDFSPGIELIAWKKGTVGANYHWFKTKFDYPAFLRQDGFHIDEYDPWFFYAAVADLNVHGFGVYYKQYIGKKARAPIGTYWRFQLDGFFYATPALQVKGNLFAFKTEFGHDFLFFDRLRVSAGFSFGIPFCLWKELGYNYSEKSFSMMWVTGMSDAFFNSSMTINDYVNARLFGHYYIGFVLSVGILSF